jgi:hypothetical protein
LNGMAEIFGQEGTVFLCYSTSSTTLRFVQQRGPVPVS